LDSGVFINANPRLYGYIEHRHKLAGVLPKVEELIAAYGYRQAMRTQDGVAQIVRPRWARWLSAALAESKISEAHLGRAMPKNEDADVGGAYTRLVRDWLKQRKTITPSSAYACGEVLLAAGLPWCSGPLALFAAGYYADAIAILGLCGAGLFQQFFPKLEVGVDAVLLDVNALQVTLSEKATPESRQIVVRGLRHSYRRALEHINATEHARWEQAAETWFLSKADGHVHRRQHRDRTIAKLDPVARQAYDIASNQALPLDWRERFIRSLILVFRDAEGVTQA
jgi:hypothetical protein